MAAENRRHKRPKIDVMNGRKTMSLTAEKRCHKRPKSDVINGPKNNRKTIPYTAKNYVKTGKKDVITANNVFQLIADLQQNCGYFFAITREIRGTLRDLYCSYVPLFPRKLFCSPRQFSEDFTKYGNSRIYAFSEDLRNFALFR